jgi:hypothetical protein
VCSHFVESLIEERLHAMREAIRDATRFNLRGRWHAMREDIRDATRFNLRGRWEHVEERLHAMRWHPDGTRVHAECTQR